MGHPSRSKGESITERYMDYGSPAQEVSKGNDIGDHYCDILAKNVITFCLCLKYLLEAKLKSFGLMAPAEEILREQIY